MNKETLNELKERAMKATKGPWMTWPTTACNGEYTGLDVMTHDGGALITEETHPSDDDALFIAAANPAAILELIALAEHSLSAQDEVPAQEPIYYSITYKGMHCNNVVRNREYAESELARLNKQYPDGDRAIVPLYTTPSPSLAVRDVVDAAPAPIQQEPMLIAYVATDLDGRYDVGTTPEKAKERAGHGCDTVFPIYDIGDNATPPALAGSQIQAAGDAAPIPGLPFVDLATPIKEFEAKNADQG